MSDLLQHIASHPVSLALVITGCALLLDLWIGEPVWLWRTVPHPVVLFGRAISFLEKRLNNRKLSGKNRKRAGIIAALCLVLLAGCAGMALQQLDGILGLSAQLVAVTILLAGRSLYDHVAAVARPLSSGDISSARYHLSMIVGRKTDALAPDAISRAAIETTAENLSDGVIAPASWYLVLGLPGIFIYKMINTADSMIGYKSARWLAFGWGAARLDDLANLIPARLTGGLIVLAAFLPRPYIAWRAMRIMWRDAGYHRSPNAGWPEAAMAGALNIVLAGPRKYGARMSTDAPLNPAGCSSPFLPPFRERTKRFVGCTFATPLLSDALPGILS